jgi:uncharacterized CHY-type Zn-finger protein
MTGPTNHEQTLQNDSSLNLSAVNSGHEVLRRPERLHVVKTDITKSGELPVKHTETLRAARDNELKQLGILFKPFPEAFRILSNEKDIQLQISVRPSDPDFPYDLEALHLRIHLPSTYPDEVPTVLITNEDLQLELKSHIENEIRKKTNTLVGQPCLRPLFRWLDKNMETLLAKKPLRAITFVSFPRQVLSTINEDKPNLNEDPCQNKSESIDQSNVKDFEILVRKKGDDIEALRTELLKSPVSKQLKETILKKDDIEMDFNSKFPMIGPKFGRENGEPDLLSTISSLDSSLGRLKIDQEIKIPHHVEHKGIQIKILTLLLDEISLMECISLRLLLRCGKCHEFKEVTLSPYISISITCDKCHTLLTIQLGTTIIHANSLALGYLDVNHAIPFDVLPSHFKITCASCDKETKLHDIMLGQKYERSCFYCHIKQRLMVEGFRFDRLIPSVINAPSVPVKSSTPKKKVYRQELGLRLGQPLENFGTCEHYGKSYRWLRFPCCGKAYPCDVCHEKKKTDGHEMVLANRMICGFCSKEQAYSQKPCICGRSLVGSSSSQFWEGGKGCRDLSRLSKKDPKKHKNSTMKTISRKAQSKTNNKPS